MSDNELEKIRKKKAQMLIKLQSMPKEIINIRNVDDLKSLSKEFNDKIIVIDFWAVWCAPCKMIEPVIEELTQDLDGIVKILKVNVDCHPMSASDYRITGVPTFVIFKDGKEISRRIGAQSKQQLLEMVKDAGIESVQKV